MIRRWWFWVSLFLALLGMGFIGESAFAQTTAVTAPSGSIQMGGTAIAQGTAVFIPVDSFGHAIPVSLSGGGLNVPGSGRKPVGYSCAIVAGAIGSGCNVPDESTASPSGFRYNVTITDTTSFGHPTSGMTYTLTGVPGVTGSGFRLDLYQPTATVPTTAALTYTHGAGAPTGGCAVPALYTDTTGQGLYQCISGGWVAIVGGSGSAFLTGGDVTGASGNLTVAGIRGTQVSTTPPTQGQVLQFDGSRYTPASVGGGAAPGRVFYNQPADTIAAIEAECSSLCTYVVTVPQTVTVGADHTLSPNVQLQFNAGGKWTVAGGHTLTIPGNVTGTLNQHFAGGTVVFGTAQASVPVEWFGAVGDWNGSSGTDNTVAIQAAIDSLTAGYATLQAKSYMISSAVTLYHSNTGLAGVRSNLVPSNIRPNPLPSSVIVSTSASADIVDVFGNSQSDMLVGAILQDFAVKRTVTPTGTASGIYLNNTFAATVIRTSSYDSIYDYHIHGSYQGGLGNIAFNSAANGIVGVPQAAAQYVGYFLDSLDGVANQTIVMYNNTQCCGPQTAGASNIGILVKGAAVNDLMVDTFQGTGSTRAIDIEYTGNGALGSATDIHVVNTIADSCAIDSGGGSCVYVNNLPVNASVDIDGGWFANALPNGPVVDIENSTGVTVRGAQLITGGSGPNMIGVKISGQGRNKVIDNSFLNLLGSGTTGVYVTNSNINAISGNTFSAGVNSGSPIPEFVHLDVTSYKNVVSGNVFDGWANYGIYNYYDTDGSSVGTSSNVAPEVLLGEMLMNAGGASYVSPFVPVVASGGGGPAFVHQWLMKDGSGATFVDTGSSPANMTASNITWGTVSGFPGTAATFNGTTSTASTAAPLTGLDTANPFTLNIWANVTSFPGGEAGAALFGALAQDGTYKGIRLAVQTNLGVDILLVNTLSGTPHVIEKASVANSFTTGAIHMFTVTYDGSGTAAGVHVYVDGNAVTNASTSDSLAGGSFAAAVPMSIGQDGGGGFRLAGTAADARIYSSALSPSQITTLYSAGVQ